MIRLRPATRADVPLLNQWDTEPRVLASDPNDDRRWEDVLAVTHDWGEQLIAELDGRPIGMIQIIDPAREVTHDWGACEPNSRAKRSRPESPFPPPAAARYGRA